MSSWSLMAFLLAFNVLTGRNPRRRDSERPSAQSSEEKWKRKGCRPLSLSLCPQIDRYI